MEAITVSAGKRVMGWAWALLGEAGNTREGIKQPHQYLRISGKASVSSPPNPGPGCLSVSLGHFGKASWGN